jgi:hypothetical protein
LKPTTAAAAAAEVTGATVAAYRAELAIQAAEAVDTAAAGTAAAV